MLKINIPTFIIKNQSHILTFPRHWLHFWKNHALN